MELLQPREAWATVVVVACIGLVNYVLLRAYGKRGIALTAIPYPADRRLYGPTTSEVSLGGWR
jgi:hypothetical protein